MSIFAILHIFAFPWRPYLLVNTPDPEAYYKGGFLGIRALLDCFNPWDIIKASARGFRWLFVGARKRHEDPSYKLETTTFDPKSNGDNILPAHKLRSDDEYSGVAMTGIQPSLHATAATTRPTTTEEDYNDNAALLRHQQPVTSVLPGQSIGHQHPSQTGLSAPYPYAPNDNTTASGYQTVATHSPSLRPIDATLPYPSGSPSYPVVMPSGMPTAITTDTRPEEFRTVAGAQRQGTWPRSPRSPHDDERWRRGPMM
jgi:hypothetical protein